MRHIFIFAIFICLTLPVFSQDANSSQTKFQALSDRMGTSVTNSNTKLDNYTQDMNDSGNTATYASYSGKYNTLMKALSASEDKLDLMIRSNDRPANIKAERDHYESLIKQLQSLKSDYDNWLSGVK